MEFYHYTAIILACPAILLFLGLCVFGFLPNRLLAELIERMFEIVRIDHQVLMMNFFGIKIDFVSSRRFRLSLVCQLSFTALVMLLLLISECIIQARHLSLEDLCPLQNSDCFALRNLWANERIFCQPGEILSNMTSSKAVCFVWVYAEQNTLSILNQIGICSSVFSLLCHAFRWSCRMSRKWWGLILLILGVLTFTTLLILSFIFEILADLTAKLLLIALSCLLINVIQLLQFTHFYKRNTFTLSIK